MKKLVALLLAVLLLFACCGCGKGKEPTVYESYETIKLEPFVLYLQFARGYHYTPEVAQNQMVLTMIVNMTYQGKEGASFALGKSSEQPYVRFSVRYGDGYVFEEYDITGNKGEWEWQSKRTRMCSGAVETDIPYLHFEPMEKTHEIQLWMIVPKTVMESENETLRLAIEVNGETILYDIGGIIDWESLYEN